MCPSQPDSPQRMTRLAGMGFQFGASLAVCTLVGWWVDHHWNTKPWGMLIGVFIGLIGGGYNFIRDALEAIRESDQEAKRRRERAGSERADERRSPRPEESPPDGGIDKAGGDESSKDD